MNPDYIIDIARETILVIIISSGPLLLIALVIGLLISIFQTVTSIQEQTLSFVPKILGVFVGVMIFGPYILGNLTELVTNLYTSFNLYLFG